MTRICTVFTNETMETVGHFKLGYAVNLYAQNNSSNYSQLMDVYMAQRMRFWYRSCQREVRAR